METTVRKTTMQTFKINEYVYAAYSLPHAWIFCAYTEKSFVIRNGEILELPPGVLHNWNDKKIGLIRGMQGKDNIIYLDSNGNVCKESDGILKKDNFPHKDYVAIRLNSHRDKNHNQNDYSKEYFEKYALMSLAGIDDYGTLFLDLKNNQVKSMKFEIDYLNLATSVDGMTFVGYKPTQTKYDYGFTDIIILDNPFL